MKPGNLVYALAVLFGIHACTLDTPDEAQQIPALQLEAHQDMSLTHLTWPRVNVTGFAEYILLQSPLDIPNAPEPETNINVTVAARFDDASVTSFSTISALLTPQTCYKLYTKINDRFLYSPTVCIDNPVDVIAGFYDRAGYDRQNNDLVMFDRINSTLSVFDLDNSALVSSVQEPLLSFPFIQVSEYQGVSAAYAFDQNQQRLRKYNLPNLSLANTHSLLNGIGGGFVSGPFIYLGTQNSGSSFQILDHITFALKDSRTGFVGVRQYAAFPGDTTTVLEIWETGKRIYRVNTNGKIIGLDEFSGGVSQLSVQNGSDVSPSHFIGGRFSTIVDKEANTITSLITDINSFTLFNRFTPDGSKAVLLTQDQVQFFLEVYDLSGLPAATRLHKYPLPAANYADIFVHDDIIYLMGIDFASSNSQTFILKIPVVS